MILADTLYRLGDAIGWDRCDYIRDGGGHIYGLTDGVTTLGLTPCEGDVWWQTSCRCDGEVEPLGSGTCPAGDTQALLGAWRRATALTDNGGGAS